jgi:hypothetical protein
VDVFIKAVLQRIAEEAAEDGVAEEYDLGAASYMNNEYLA